MTLLSDSFGYLKSRGLRSIERGAEPTRRLSSRLFAATPYILPSLLLTVVFFIQCLKVGGNDAGFLFSGDVLGYYWPALLKLHRLFHNHIFVPLDFSTYNASSAFLLTANLSSVHPFVVVSSLLLPGSLTFGQSGFWLILLIFVHFFLAAYFAHRLLCEFLYFPYLLGLAAAVVFSFSHYGVNSLGEPTFIFSVYVLPWMAYAALRWVYLPSLSNLLWGCLPVICGILGGYGPLGLFAAAMSLAVVGLQTLAIADEPRWRQRVRRCVLGAAPLALSALLLSPYLRELLRFNAETGSARTSGLFYSAFQLADAPQSIIGSLSPYLLTGNRLIEFTPTFGLVAIAVAVVFVFSGNAILCLARRDQVILLASAAAFLICTLAVYGQYSPVSNLIYHFVPVIGRMHIYQRFLLGVNLFYGVSLVLMLKAIVTARPDTTVRIVLALGLGALLWGAYNLSSVTAGVAAPPAKIFYVSNELLFELMCASIALFALLVPSARVAYLVVTLALLMTPLARIYSLSQGMNTLEYQKPRMPLALDPIIRGRVVEYFKQRSAKTIYKYADLTPFWTKDGIESFPKSFPYMVLDDITLSSYGGFSFYLSARQAYMDRMPVRGEDVALQPDWNLLAAQGADVVIAPADLVRSGKLGPSVSQSDIADGYLLSNAAMMVPLHSLRKSVDAERRSVFDNGYFRVSAATMVTSDGVNLALRKPAEQAGGNDPGLAVDGNTDGDFARGSVAHTAQDANAWFQVDLGADYPIDAVKLWMRTDCCAIRMSDIWLFVSPKPFAPRAEAGSDIAARPDVWSRRIQSNPRDAQTVRTNGARGRYVRVQLAGTQLPDDSFLQLAEIQVHEGASPPAATAAGDIKVTGFSTNNANAASITVTTPLPISIDYLLSDNPRNRYLLDGKQVRPDDSGDVLTFAIPAGTHTLRMEHHNRVLAAFWIMYGLYGLALVLVSLLAAVRTFRAPAAGLPERAMATSPS